MLNILERAIALTPEMRVLRSVPWYLTHKRAGGTENEDTALRMRLQSQPSVDHPLNWWIKMATVSATTRDDLAGQFGGANATDTCLVL